MTTLNAGFNDYRIGIIGAAYASAFHMIRTDRAWEQFLKDPGWGGLSGKPKDTLQARNRMLLHVMRYIFRAEGENARRRVRVYAGMLQDRFHKGYLPEDVVPLINRWGIEHLREAGQAQRKAERQGTKDPFFDDLNDLDADEDVLPPRLVDTEEAELTPAQTERFVRVLATFNAKLMSY